MSDGDLVHRLARCERLPRSEGLLPLLLLALVALGCSSPVVQSQCTAEAQESGIILPSSVASPETVEAGRATETKRRTVGTLQYDSAVAHYRYDPQRQRLLLDYGPLSGMTSRGEQVLLFVSCVLSKDEMSRARQDGTCNDVKVLFRSNEAHGERESTLVALDTSRETPITDGVVRLESGLAEVPVGVLDTRAQEATLFVEFRVGRFRVAPLAQDELRHICRIIIGQCRKVD